MKRSYLLTQILLRLSVTILSLLTPLFLITGTIYASNHETSLNPCPPGSDSALCKTIDLEFASVIGNLIQFIFVIAVVLALGFLVFGGIKWITSGGDKGNVESARGTIIAAIIGLIIVFLAYVILNLVLTFLTGEGIGSLTIPYLADISDSPPANAQTLDQNTNSSITQDSYENSISPSNVSQSHSSPPSPSMTKGGIGY